ncbi:restriction endonuclease subunit S [Vibrio navarrensis]|nr:restriction endonuclease subunit S [Vibrio navarrensis]
MSSNWPTVTIQELIDDGVILVHKDGNHGSNYPRTAEFGEEGIPFLTAKLLDDSGNIDFDSAPRLSTDKANKFKFGFLEPNDVLLSHNATVGRVAVVPAIKERMLIGTSLTHYRLDSSRLLPKYLAAYFSGIAFQNQLASVMSQTTRNQVPITSQRKLSVVVPPIEDQKIIADMLGAFDDKIQNNTQTNQTLEQIAQAIFKSWFVDFDPVKAKIETLAAGGSADDAELAAMGVISTKTLDELNSLKASNPEAFNKLAQTAALFPAAMQNSELGEIPVGWEISEIGNEVIVVGGGTPSTKNTEFWEDGTIHWTTPKDMSGLNCKVLTNTDRKITEAGLKKISSGLLSKNTVLMSSRAPVGYLALAKIPVAINQGYIAMKCEGRLSPEYVLLWCEHNMEEIKQRASGTTFAEISKANFKPIPVIVPTKSIIDTFTVQASDIYNIVHANVLQSETLSISRDLLLPQLLSGELSDVFKDGE